MPVSAQGLITTFCYIEPLFRKQFVPYKNDGY